MNLEPYLAFATDLARASGEFIRPYFGRLDLAVELKADDTPVTAADRGAEELMRDMILARFPEHGIVGEEFGSERADAEFVWVLDPIDGTKSFTAGVPLFGTLIALQHQGQPVIGVINQPVLGRLMVGDGSTTTLNGTRVRTRRTVRPEDATLLCTDILDVGRHQGQQGFEALSRRAKLFRTWGDCYGYMLVAAGWADIMCDPIMDVWDLSALIPVILGAGGVITDWQGRDPVNARSTVASATAELHERVIAALNG